MDATTASHGVTLLGPVHQTLARARGWKALILSALFGAFAALAFAPFHLTIGLAVSFTGLVWMVDGARGLKHWGKAVFLRGWGFGYGYFLVSLHWTAAAFLVDPQQHAIFLWMPLILLPGGMALIWGAALAMAGAFWSASPSRIFAFALFFALAEWVRGTLFGGFPWNLAGTSWLPGGAVSQAAGLGGVYWLTAITVLACATPAALVDTRQERSLALRFVPSLVAVIALASLWAWGAQTLATETEYTETDIVLMDVGVPQAEKYEEGFANPQVFRRYLEFLNEIPFRSTDIVIWPEGATGSVLLEARQLEPVTAYLGPRRLIAGTARTELDQGVYTWYNSIAVLSENSARTGAAGLYDKHRLVPVGELPVSRILPFGETISSILPGALQQMATSGFTPGPSPSLVYSEGVPPFVAMICYEGLYPGVTREAQTAAGHRADWIVLVSNDGWFGTLIGPAQHYAQNRYRAIETGLPIARVAARGVSAIIDGHGREVMRTKGLLEDIDNWDGQVGRGTLPKPANVPFYQSRGGQILFPVTLVLFAVFAFLVWRR
ncbi:MAG: apolipoprotein N-acyltransferase [Pseudomonadota bacterium]